MKKLYKNIESGYYHKAYSGGNPVQRYWHTERFKKIIHQVNPKKKILLDLGCGPGTLLSQIPQTYTKVIGIDFDEKQIDFAKKEFKNYKRITWIAGDVNKIHFKEKFDYILCSEVIEHLKPEHADRLLRLCYELLKKDGKLILTTPNYRSFWPLIEKAVNFFGKVDYSEQHINKMNRASLKSALLKNKFKVDKLETFYIAAPFTSVISYGFAKKLQKAEEILLPRLGSILLAVASK